MCGAPQRRFSMLMRLIRARTSAVIGGRPSRVPGPPAPIGAKSGAVPADDGLGAYDSHGLENRRKQAIQKEKKKRRSLLVSWTRPCTLRCSTASCCPSAAFSASSRLRDFTKSIRKRFWFTQVGGSLRARTCGSGANHRPNDERTTKSILLSACIDPCLASSLNCPAAHDHDIRDPRGVRCVGIASAESPIGGRPFRWILPLMRMQ